MIKNITQEYIKTLIEESLGYMIADNFLDSNVFFKFQQLEINFDDTDLYLDLIEKYSLKEYDYKLEVADKIFQELINGRKLKEPPKFKEMKGASYPFSIVTKQWKDEFGTHVLMAIVSESGISEPAIFDVNLLSKLYVGSLN